MSKKNGLCNQKNDLYSNSSQPKRGFTKEVWHSIKDSTLAPTGDWKEFSCQNHIYTKNLYTVYNQRISNRGGLLWLARDTTNVSYRAHTSFPK
jgi:hypothetical protein